MRMDCAAGKLISPKKLEHVLKKLKNGKGSPDQITADVLKALPPEFPGRLAVLVDGDGSESGGCNVLDEIQTDSWIVCDAESFGLCMAQATLSTEI